MVFFSSLWFVVFHSFCTSTHNIPLFYFNTWKFGACENSRNLHFGMRTNHLSNNERSWKIIHTYTLIQRKWVFCLSVWSVHFLLFLYYVYRTVDTHCIWYLRAFVLTGEIIKTLSYNTEVIFPFFFSVLLSKPKTLLYICIVNKK